jgi:hypothetical protein
MMTPDDLHLINERFTERYSDEFGRIYTANDSNTIICELLLPYTPIDDFMNLLKQQMFLIEMYGCDKFVFDKRAIRGFHQPSMEWYYLTWKVDAYRRFGLAKHRKLFTNEEWFLKCVEAGRAQIRQKDPGSIVHTLDIKVCQTLAEAVNT